MNLAAPVDWLLNVGATPYWPELRAETTTLCVLQHGLIRSACSLMRLQSTLLRHGYAVLNRSYPSVWGTIEAHAERLQASLERRLTRDGTAADPPRLCYLGHSMGGLVVRACLARADARAADDGVAMREAAEAADHVAVAVRVGRGVGLEVSSPSPSAGPQPVSASVPPSTRNRRATHASTNARSRV